ncbi:bactofilin family protein [Brevundimonas pishanensis]|uniref:bactofilin family protein n=1 Tax=Brevundimonas pishanensis TaxID=2896315 RepID=UPI001FA773BB|nr:polymer-forming cytoskeletal protein [Brevundimonas pishanensis]
MFNKGKPYVPPPTRAMGTASGHDDLHDLDDAELELDTEVLSDIEPATPSTAYSHAAEERMGSHEDQAAEESVIHVAPTSSAQVSEDPGPAPAPATAPQGLSDTVGQGGGARSSGGWGSGRTGGAGGSGGSGGGFGSNPSRPSREAASVLGNGMTFEGDISGVGELVIEGTVKGDVRVSQVLINEKGAVEGTVHADVLDVRGRVSGAIVAKQVHLHASSHVEGDITQEQLVIERGAWFSGRSTQAKRGEEAPAAQD